MALDEYRRKRRLGETPEPSGGEPGTGGTGIFAVQRHAARRLHYDFRLEIGGTLKSWAVPKGPSLDPAEKRLAVRTEDHPIEYGDFEGEIPEGHYGAGTVQLWDRGVWFPEGPLAPEEQLERGELKFRLRGHKLRGGFVLVRMKTQGGEPGEQWLLIKHKDPFAAPGWKIGGQEGSVAAAGTLEAARLEGACRAARPERVEVMLAASVPRAFSDPAWLFEVKWDGMRAVAVVEGSAYRLYSRTGRDVTAQFPELGVLPESVLARTAVLDGEIVVLDERGRSSFERLQPRIKAARPSPALLRQAPVDYYVFDVIHCDGWDLRRTPLGERKRFLRSLLAGAPPVRFSSHVVERGEELFALVQREGAEGVIAKRIDSPYESGRSEYWKKIKAVRELDAVVGGYTAPRGGRRYFGALLAGLYRGGRLEFAGGVGAGFKESEQAALMEALAPLRTARCPFARTPETDEPAVWVEPRLVIRVRYAEITAEGRLRAPVYAGLRTDAVPEDCRLEDEAPQVVRAPALETREAIEAELFSGERDEAVIELDGVRLRLTNLNKVFFPERGYTKRALLAYYWRVADHILPFLQDRPLVLHRHPDGVAGPAFYQKAAGAEKPPWMKTVPIRSEARGEAIEYYTVSDRASLLFLANLGSIEFHPWPSRIDDLEHPDYVFFDLDPAGGTPYGVVTEVARVVVRLLGRAGCPVFVKTSGATGMHLVVPLERCYGYDEVRAFAEIVGRLAAEQAPERIDWERAPGKRRPGSVYFDYSQNAYGRPLASVYSVRPMPAATVSTPVSARQLRPALTPERYTIETVPKLLAKRPDPWAKFWESRQRLEPVLERLRRSLRFS
jgi:bifunctional non-homologous end joining protein LigD